MSEQKKEPQPSSDSFMMSLEDKLYRTRYEVDQSFSHIRIKEEVCRQCEQRICLFICPAKVYTQPSDDSNLISANYENCLECGTCRVACTNEGIEWSFPNGGMGVKFRFG
jgi:ferredoxin like protein